MPKKNAQYTKLKNEFFQTLNGLNSNENDLDSPVFQRVIELGRDKHLPLYKAIEIAEKEYENQ